ncbi:MAG: hypothetical protein RIR51_1549 [Bacteroidota bacterium]
MKKQILHLTNMKNLRILISSILLSGLFFACQETEKLPVLGPPGHTIPDFELINQDSLAFGTKNLEGKIFVVDFFFTTCPTICPIMKTQLLRVYKKYHDDDNLRLVSISIDPDFDQPAVLKDFTKKLNIDTNFWTFLTGDQEYIFNLGEKNFLVTTQKDDKELGGYLHSGALILIDTNRQIRGIYDGTKEDEVNELIRDIKRVKSEE